MKPYYCDSNLKIEGFLETSITIYLTKEFNKLAETAETTAFVELHNDNCDGITHNQMLDKSSFVASSTNDMRVAIASDIQDYHRHQADSKKIRKNIADKRYAYLISMSIADKSVRVIKAGEIGFIREYAEQYKKEYRVRYTHYMIVDVLDILINHDDIIRYNQAIANENELLCG